MVTHKLNRKRVHPMMEEENELPKRTRANVNVINNEDSEFHNDLHDKAGYYKLGNTKQYSLKTLTGLMYQIDLSILCSLRAILYKHKYPSLSLAFENSGIDKFNNIVLRYENKSIHIRVENVDKHYINNDINYARLFTKERRGTSINSFFNGFVKYLISNSILSNNVEYLVVYTNSCLDLTEENKLKKGKLRQFYPFKFDNVNLKDRVVLKDFLFTKGVDFYQFSRDDTTELLKELEFSASLRKAIGKRKLPIEFEKETKEAFLDKLVFAVNQPNRTELSSIIKIEMGMNSKVQDKYLTLQKRISSNIEERGKLGNVSEILYDFNLLMTFLHDMFVHKSMFFINFELYSHDLCNYITVNYKSKIIYVKTLNIYSNIGYSHLFPSKQFNNAFSIHKLFTLFVEKIGESIKYFIVYTNADLNLTEENKFKKEISNGFFALKFNRVDIQKKRHKILRKFSCLNHDGLYQFSQEETTRKELLKLLIFSPSFRKETLYDKSEKEIKEIFLDRIIFAVNQYNREKLNSVIQNKVDKPNIPYNYGELHEITLRWLESYELGPVTKSTMEKLLGDVKNNRLSCQKIQNKDTEKVKFAKSVVGKVKTSAFDEFLEFLIQKEGNKYLENLKRNGINITSMSSILNGTKVNPVKVFKELYDLWFDAEGNKREQLRILEKEGVNFTNMS